MNVGNYRTGTLKVRKKIKIDRKLSQGIMARLIGVSNHFRVGFSAFKSRAHTCHAFSFEDKSALLQRMAVACLEIPEH